MDTAPALLCGPFCTFLPDSPLAPLTWLLAKLHATGRWHSQGQDVGPFISVCLESSIKKVSWMNNQVSEWNLTRLTNSKGSSLGNSLIVIAQKQFSRTIWCWFPDHTSSGLFGVQSPWLLQMWNYLVFPFHIFTFFMDIYSKTVSNNLL